MLISAPPPLSQEDSGAFVQPREGSLHRADLAPCNPHSVTAGSRLARPAQRIAKSAAPMCASLRTPSFPVPIASVQRADTHRRADRREENLEVKARKRLAREQKAQYKALGIEPPPKLNAGRRRWEHNIRFEQQKLRGVSMPQQQQPARASEPVVAPSPQGFSSTTTTTTWRLGDSIQGPTPQSAPVATEERRGYFDAHLEPATRSGPPQAPLSYAFPPVKPVCGPMPAYSPYPLTPPMDEYQPGPRLDGNNALGLFSPPEPYGNGPHSPWLSPSPVAAPVFATSRVPSLRLQRSVAFQPAPKPLHHVPPPPEPLSFVPSPRQVVPYPSPQMSTQFLPLALPATAPLLPPPAPLYAPDPARPAATCDFIPRVAATPPLSERERSSPPPPPQQEQEDPLSASASLLSGGPSVSMPLSVLAQAEYPQTDFGHSAVSAAATTSYEAPAVSAPTMFPSTSWSGSLYMPNARHPSASYPTDSWLVEDTHAHSTPELYSSAGW